MNSEPLAEGHVPAISSTANAETGGGHSSTANAVTNEGHVPAVSSTSTTADDQATQTETRQSDSLEDTGWYLNSDDGVVGPFSLPQLRQKYQLDELDGLTSIWQEGMEAWLPVAEVPDLKEKLQRASSQRPAIADVPMQHTYTDQYGVLHIYDISEEVWTSADDYERLLRVDTEDLVEVSGEELDSKAPGKRERSESLGTLMDSLGENGDVVDGKKAKRQAYRERKKLKKQAGLWSQAKSNPNCYVSGLPADVTEDELATLFTRSGVIKIDATTGKPKVKIYVDPATNSSKGDALVTYARQESVELAVKFLHEHEIRPSCKICVQQAEFEDKEKRIFSKAELVNKAAEKKEQRKRYAATKNEVAVRMDWGDGEAVQTRKQKKVIVLRRMFGEEEASTWTTADYDILAQEIKDECMKFGDVHKVVPIEHHPEGIVCVKFKDQVSCEACLQVMNGRIFDGRTIVAQFHTGTDFKAFMVQAGRGIPEAEELVKPVSAVESKPVSDEMRSKDPQGTDSWEARLEDTSSDEDMIIHTEE